MLPRSIALVPLVLLTSICVLAADGEADDRSDEQTLRAAQLRIDGPSLLTLFRKRTPDADSQGRIKTLIEQLGSDSFTQREEAGEELASFGVAAVGLLRAATHHADLEIRWRARDVLAVIEQSDLSADVLIASLRVLGRRKPPGLDVVLLDYAPHAADADINEELCLALTSSAMRDGRDNPRLVQALTDKSPIKRAIAAAALTRGGCRKQLSAVRRLLHDPDLQVRRRVALALLEARDKSAVPVLIELLTELPLVEAEHVESMLLQISGDNTPKGSLDAGRGKYRDAWAEWWKEQGDRLDLAKIDLATNWRGYTLAVCMMRGRGRVGRGGCIAEYDALGRVRWQIKGLFYPLAAQVLDEKRVLVTEYSPGAVTERNHSGDVVRRLNISDNPLEAYRLPNGNTLITTRNRVYQLDRKDKEVWTANSQRGDMIVAACPLPGGEVAICYRMGEIVRVDQSGKELNSFRSEHRFGSTGLHIQGLPNGHILVPMLNDNKVVEFDKKGREVWSASYPQPTCAQRLPNGRTLVISFGSNAFAELDKNGHEIKSQQVNAPLVSVRGR